MTTASLSVTANKDLLKQPVSHEYVKIITPPSSTATIERAQEFRPNIGMGAPTNSSNTGFGMIRLSKSGEKPIEESKATLSDFSEHPIAKPIEEPRKIISKVPPPPSEEIKGFVSRPLPPIQNPIESPVPNQEKYIPEPMLPERLPERVPERLPERQIPPERVPEIPAEPSFDPAKHFLDELMSSSLPLYRKKELLMMPLPKFLGTLECSVIRDKSGLSKKVYPQYVLILSNNSMRIMTGQKLNMFGSAHYILTLETENMTKEGPGYLGKLRGNSPGTEYNIFGPGANPSTKMAIEMLRPQFAGLLYVTFY